jgi:diguanylate cyclase (GGDEF)-like protein
MDLDKFKHVNDSFGHAAGDALLREVAARLKRAIRAEDTAARVGGDEFAVVLAQISHAGDAAVVAQKIIESMAAPMLLEGHEHVVTVSIGITLYPADGAEAGQLLRNADAAMFRAKQAGRNCFRFHDAAMDARAA